MARISMLFVFLEPSDFINKKLSYGITGLIFPRTMRENIRKLLEVKDPIRNTNIAPRYG
jgi:hypothetical protein